MDYTEAGYKIYGLWCEAGRPGTPEWGVSSIANIIRELDSRGIEPVTQAAPVSQLKEMSACLERERTAVAEGVKAVKDALDHRHWLTEGRGPYEWDDDRWHGEFAAAAKEVFDALKPLEAIARDFKFCPTTSEEIKAARGAAPVSPRQDVLEELLAHIQWMKEHGELRIKQTRYSVELNAFNQGRVDAAESLLGFMDDLLKQHGVTLTPPSKEKS